MSLLNHHPTVDGIRPARAGRQRNATVMLGEVEEIDLEARRLVVASIGRRSEVPYDSLIIATGAEHAYFGHPEFAQHARDMKTIDDALELRGRIFGAFEP